MPQMQYEDINSDEYSKRISKHITENINSGVETLGNNYQRNISPYM